VPDLPGRAPVARWTQQRDGRARRRAGVTLVELLVTIAILAIIAMMALPIVEIRVKMDKERELRTALREIRDALDAYRRAHDAGRIARIEGESGYPPSLLGLIRGVTDEADPAGRKLRFLVEIPGDPFNTDRKVPAEQTWGLRSYASPPEAPRPGADVYDVYSLNPGKGLDGVPYREW
jgi:general secretion pathway protein G